MVVRQQHRRRGMAEFQSDRLPLGPFFIHSLATGHSRHRKKANTAASMSFIHNSIGPVSLCGG